MLQTLSKLTGLALMIVIGTIGYLAYQRHTAVEQRLVQLEQEKQILEQVVERLGQERRMAEVLVTEQRYIDGKLHTTLLFVEYDRQNRALPPKSFTVIGQMAHIDALVIKFEHDLVRENDPLRGHSIALFQRIFGDAQTPEDAPRIDKPGTIPEIYRGASPKASRFEMELWEEFWRLARDPDYAATRGVRVAMGQSVWGPFEPDRLYTITVEPAGGLSITSEPLKPIYREALRRAAEAQL